MKTIKDNKLVAEFMGFVYVPEDAIDYSKSWNWLMPVVEKIEKMVNNFYVGAKYSLIYTGFMFKNTDDYQWQENGGTKIENTYAVIVEFIKWYNNEVTT